MPVVHRGFCDSCISLNSIESSKGGSTLVMLPHNITPYCDSVSGSRDRVTYQKLVTRSRYGLVRCAVGIWLSHQRDDMVTAGASVDMQRHTTRPRHPFDVTAKYRQRTKQARNVTA